MCLTIFTAMVIPRDGNSSSSSWSSRSSSAYWGDLVEMANMTVALRHEALAACFLLPPSAAAGPGLSEDGQQIPTSCPPNTSSSHHGHHGIQIQVTIISLFVNKLCPFWGFACSQQFQTLTIMFLKSQLMNFVSGIAKLVWGMSIIYTIVRCCYIYMHVFY